jgi:hypothetical protein
MTPCTSRANGCHMAIKLGEDTISSRLENAKVEATKPAKVYYDAVRALGDFHESATLLIETETIRQRRIMLIRKRDEAYQVLKERNQIWDWMRAESNRHRTDNGEPRVKD